MIIAFVPCRLNSTRLPNKAIQDVHGISAIERCLINTMSIPGIDKVVLATSTNKEDDQLLDFNLDGKIEVTRGSEDDVLERFMPAIHKYRPDQIIRVTGDCPLVSPELGELSIKKHLESKSDLTYTNSKIALGIGLEVYKTEAVLRLKEIQKKTNYSEYLIYYFTNNRHLFSVNEFEAPDNFIKPWRLTLDEQNDLELLRLIYTTLEKGKEPVSFKEVESFFQLFPLAALTNICNEVKYRDNQELMELLKSVTTIKSK
jgi:spore coat polysaccharide biosynthesis protein SpsF (cytidylyltransferase family)